MKNNKIKFLFAFFVLFTATMSGQVDDGFLLHNDFVKTFEDEQKQQGNVEMPAEPKFLLAPAWFVPQWIVNFSNAGQIEGYMIGISDPGLDEEVAARQAELRAVSLHLLLQRVNVKNLTDYYSNEVENVDVSMYEYFSRATAQSDMLDYTIVDSAKSNFGEKIYLLKFGTTPVPSPKWGNKLSLRTDLYKGEIQYRDQTEYKAHFQLVTTNAAGDTLLDYMLTEIGSNFETLSYMEGKELIGSTYPYVYIPGHNEKNEEIKCYLAGGLWKEFYKSLLNQILNLSQINCSKVGKMSERMQPSFEKNTRNLSNNLLRFGLHSFSIEKTFVKVEMSGTPLAP